MKYEWKRFEKYLYGAKSVPALAEIPKQWFIMIDGRGNPNDGEFSEKVSALYSAAYAVKMRYKSLMSENDDPDVIGDYSVYPLEGIWRQKEGVELIKDELEYTIMIRQPDFITEDMVNAALDHMGKKKPNPFYEKIHFDAMQDGKCIEILHVGAYDDEPDSFEKMDRMAERIGLRRREDWHREIYLNNARRVDESRLRTILRYAVE